MKKYIILLTILLTSLYSFSQNNRGSSDDSGRIALNTFIPSDVLSDFPSAKKMLEVRLNAVASMNGMGANEALPRFIISGNAFTVFDETLDTYPPKFVKTVEVLVSIGDGIEGVEYASEFIELKGIDEAEDKAFISAIRKLNPRNRALKSLVENAKNKIIEYYNAKCDFILKEAETLSSNKDFDNSLAVLVEVPEVCKECYDKAMDFSTLVYKQKVENECQLNISQANAFIAQDKWDDASNSIVGVTPDMQCYEEVSSIQQKITDHRCAVSIGKARGAWANRDSNAASLALSEVSWDSACYEDAQKLFQEISSLIDEKKQREWDLAYEKYNRDQIMREEVNELEIEIVRSNQNMNELNAESQRKINELDADAKAYLTKKTADNQMEIVKIASQTAIKTARANARKKPATYNYNVNKY